MKLTSEQSNAIKHQGHALVEACPGSGKTRAIIAKLLRCVDDVRDTTRRVACITYTNAAVHEIEDRIRLYGATGDEDYCEVATIHGFCQNNILRHFHWRLPEYANGYTIVPSDSDEFGNYVDQIADKFDLNDYQKAQFELLNRAPSGSPITPADIPAAAATEFWQLLQRNRLIDFCNIVYFSYRLLADDPSLPIALGARFKHLLVDEFQDTSELQVDILKLIAGTGCTTVFLVGDPEQSIYGFAGARRNLMFEFAQHLGAKSFPLSGNFRSSTPVVRSAELLLPRTPAMFAAGDWKDFAEEPFHAHADNNLTAITDFFLPTIDALTIPLGQCAILAPSWFHLRPIGMRLREYGVAVVGPGARPYKRSHLFARLAEQVCAYVECPQPHIIRPIEKEIFQLVSNLTGKADFRIFTFDGRRIIFRLLHAAHDLRSQHEAAAAWLNATAPRFGEILVEERLAPPSCPSLLQQSVAGMLADMAKAEVDIPNLTLSDLGMFADPEKNLKLLTIHQAKGREFTAVAVVGLHDGIIPYHNKYNALSSDGEAEARRLFYVAMTRARRILHLFTDRGDWRPKCRFLKSLGVE
jgi:DNA helicase-2/ATP-dependent DNA helicase PcrA